MPIARFGQGTGERLALHVVTLYFLGGMFWRRFGNVLEVFWRISVNVAELLSLGVKPVLALLALIVQSISCTRLLNLSAKHSLPTTRVGHGIRCQQLAIERPSV